MTPLQRIVAVAVAAQRDLSMAHHAARSPSLSAEQRPRLEAFAEAQRARLAMCAAFFATLVPANDGTFTPTSPEAA